MQASSPVQASERGQSAEIPGDLKSRLGERLPDYFNDKQFAWSTDNVYVVRTGEGPNIRYGLADREGNELAGADQFHSFRFFGPLIDLVGVKRSNSQLYLPSGKLVEMRRDQFSLAGPDHFCRDNKLYSFDTGFIMRLANATERIRCVKSDIAKVGHFITTSRYSETGMDGKKTSYVRSDVFDVEERRKITSLKNFRVLLNSHKDRLIAEVRDPTGKTRIHVLTDRDFNIIWAPPGFTGTIERSGDAFRVVAHTPPSATAAGLNERYFASHSFDKLPRNRTGTSLWNYDGELLWRSSANCGFARHPAFMSCGKAHLLSIRNGQRIQSPIPGTQTHVIRGEYVELVQEDVRGNIDVAGYMDANGKVVAAREAIFEDLFMQHDGILLAKVKGNWWKLKQWRP